jgi:hypothetical protein
LAFRAAEVVGQEEDRSWGTDIRAVNQHIENSEILEDIEDSRDQAAVDADLPHENIDLKEDSRVLEGRRIVGGVKVEVLIVESRNEMRQRQLILLQQLQQERP